MKHRITYRWEDKPTHSILRVWVNGASAGELTVKNAGCVGGRPDDERDVLVAVLRALCANGATENR